jgi:gamma-glutamyltranspeptidase/glutathione hydrolase
MMPLLLMTGWLAAAESTPAAPATVPAAPAITPAAPATVPAEQRRNLLQERRQRFHGVWSPGGAVASQEPLAARAGVEVLRQGGNAVDAAVASSFALAVTHPQAGNLGGGGFLVLWLPGPSPAAARGCLQNPGTDGAPPSPELRIGRGTAVAVNFRETAPRSAREDLFLKPDGSVDRRKATASLLSSGVPGSVAGLVLAQRCYGTLPLETVMAPAIALAGEGFVVGPELSASLSVAARRLLRDPTSRELFFRPTNADPVEATSVGWRPPRPGELLRQPALATTLRRIASQGEKGFYGGPVADAMVKLMRQGGGLITHRDLGSYRARLVRPLSTTFKGHPVITMPPPSSGLTLLQLLGLLEPFDLADSGLNSAATIHLMVEAMNLAYRDRNELLGDPDQITIPVQRLLGATYLKRLRQRIDPRRHRPSARISDGVPERPREGANTTHLSVADRNGGIVATTTTLNFSYGNGISVPGAGFLLNNEMDDFTAHPGTPNSYGLVQGRANAIAPGRRPLSSMSPTLVFTPDAEPWLATGSPGGSRIITTVLQVLINRVVHGLNLATAVASPRVHSQLWPDRLSIEQGISPDTVELLQSKGHDIQPTFSMGAANSIEVLPARGGVLGLGGTWAVADPRRAEGAAVGE